MGLAWHSLPVVECVRAVNVVDIKFGRLGDREFVAYPEVIAFEHAEMVNPTCPWHAGDEVALHVVRERIGTNPVEESFDSPLIAIGEPGVELLCERT
jgi:hypothetical protein